MKKFIYGLMVMLVFAIVYSCSDHEEELNENRISTENITLRGGDGDGEISCDESSCAGNWFPNNYINWAYGSNDNPCEFCVWFIAPEGVSGDLCVTLTNVDNLDDGLSVFVDDITFSGTVSSGEKLCIPMEFSASFDISAVFITDEGCSKTTFGNSRVFVTCSTCCEDENASVTFTEYQTSNIGQTICGQIYVSLDTDCPGPFSYEYYPEAGTGLKDSGSGSGTNFIISTQDDCGLLGPGSYTVTFNDGECFSHTATYYFEPCNSDLYDENNPAAMQMSSLSIFCSGGGGGGDQVQFRSSTVAKCCNCVGSEITIEITNANGDTRTINGGVTLEAGCHISDAFFKRLIDYDPADWTPFGNLVEIFDCEGNVIWSEEYEDPQCD